jgi:hypothetical protein
VRNYYYDFPDDPVRKGDAGCANGCAALVATVLGSIVWLFAFVLSFSVLGIPGAVCFALFVGVAFVYRLYTAKANSNATYSYPR